MNMVVAYFKCSLRLMIIVTTVNIAVVRIMLISYFLKEPAKNNILLTFQMRYMTEFTTT